MAWVHPATGQRWDGQQWLGPALPVGPVPISRGAIFLHVAWRTLVAAIGGGMAIVVLIFTAITVWELINPPENGSDNNIVWILLGLVVGAVFGAILGVPAAAVLGGMMAWRGVPYPGPRRTRLIARLTGMAMVLLFLLTMFHDVFTKRSFDLDAMPLFVMIYGGGLGGAWFLASWTVRWYIRRMTPD